jgi:hypothetical protein
MYIFCKSHKILLECFADGTLEDVKTRLIGLLVSRKIILAPLHPGLHLGVVISTNSKALLNIE